MAENKKSFIAYIDWYYTFKALPDDKAGQLIKHLFAYVNDENPTIDDMLINAVFANIKQTLKRDLKKYEEIRKNRAIAGKKGGEKSGEARKQNEANEANASFDKQNEASIKQNEANEAVNDSVNVNVKDKLINSLKNEFSNQLKLTFQNPTDWEKVQLNKFFNYWTEPNKSKTKIKWQMEKTWDLKLRVNTWLNNAEGYEKQRK